MKRIKDRKDALISALMEYIYGDYSTQKIRRIFVDIIGLTPDEIKKYGFEEVLNDED